ncbi:MAG TPA: beta-ketoacyl-ACP synthase III [Gemmatimonadaceae bacterium]|nr:beta-ketoacyl-ACP synthase III [Gemmatimonadaceae bacterium]
MKRPIAQLTGVGSAAPSRVVTNYDLAATGLETSHEWIVERTGIVERHVCGEGESTCSMAADASRAALERAGVAPADVDVVLLSTATPDRLLPATAVELQAALGATRATAFDLSAACSGWLYGITVGEGLIASGAARTVLVAGSEKMSAIVDWTDRSTCVLFGDGAGATVLQPANDGRGILSTFTRSDGRLAELLWRPDGGAAIPMSERVVRERTHLVKMAGREVFKAAVRSMCEAADCALQRAGIDAADVDLLIPHQANVRIIEATAKHAGIPSEKVFVNVDRYGNTSSASLPIALDEAIRGGRVHPGATVLFVAFGAGFTWASMVVRF